MRGDRRQSKRSVVAVRNKPTREASRSGVNARFKVRMRDTEHGHRTEVDRL